MPQARDDARARARAGTPDGDGGRPPDLHEALGLLDGLADTAPREGPAPREGTVRRGASVGRTVSGS